VNLEIKNNILNFKLIFWDFDGVIKESNHIKSKIFSEIFDFQDKYLEEKIIRHHYENSGVSRYLKIPKYLSWSNKNLSENNIRKYSKKFSDEVVDQVIKSPWVPGVKEFLSEMPERNKNIIVTATPTNEIHKILKELEITNFFLKIYGHPVEKSDAIEQSLRLLDIKPNEACFIGDASQDLLSARRNNISFFLRKTIYNSDLAEKADSYFEDFSNE